MSHRNDELGVDVRESGEFRLVEVHDEELVGWRQFRSFTRKLTVEISNVFDAFLEKQHQF